MMREQTRLSVDVSWLGKRTMRAFEGPKRRLLPVGQAPKQATSILRHRSFACCPGGGSLLARAEYGEQSIRIPSWRKIAFLYEAPEMFQLAGSSRLFKEFGLRN